MRDKTPLLEIAALHPGDNHFHLTPDVEARRAIAARLGEPGVESLDGEFALRPFGGGVNLDLRVRARVNRICVASLEPMIEAIDERYAIQFERNYVEVAADDDDETVREPLEGDTLDLEEILIQHLVLSLDPHPRKSGAKSLAEDYKDPVNLSPFSGLKGLVDGDA